METLYFFSDGNIGDHLAAGVKNGIIGGISGAAFGAAFGAGAHWFSKLPKAIPDTKLPSTTTGNLGLIPLMNTAYIARVVIMVIYLEYY
ncbi:MAG: hypothetical protein IPJ13_15430 [Saprospiraceae bacterium]|nr:hypothetical protein [Saprospiraceae bacterium]